MLMMMMMMEFSKLTSRYHFSLQPPASSVQRWVESDLRQSRSPRPQALYFYQLFLFLLFVLLLLVVVFLLLVFVFLVTCANRALLALKLSTFINYSCFSFLFFCCSLLYFCYLFLYF